MNEKLKIAVLGLGHVGLPTALGFAHIGSDVIGTDSDLDKLNLISNGDTPFYEPGIDQMLEKYLKQGTFKIEKNQVKAIQDAECIFVGVGTPQNDDGSADLSQLETVAKTIAENIDGYKLIVEKSTTPVTTAASLKRSIQRHMQSRKTNESKTHVFDEFDVAVNVTVGSNCCQKLVSVCVGDALAPVVSVSSLSQPNKIISLPSCIVPVEYILTILI